MIRKRKIAALVKPHAISLMNEYFNNEHALAVYGTSVISDKREIEICNTLSNYAEMMCRNFDDESDVYNNEWAKELSNFN